MKRRVVVALVLLVLVGLGSAAALTSPPGLLSFLDTLMGGGIGVDRVGRDIAFGTHGQTLDVYDRSPGLATMAVNKPVLIFWYGGGWVHGNRRAYGFAARAFARAGFVVVVPDYRKVPEIRFPAMLQDGAEAVKWTRDHISQYAGDPARIGVAGHSAGAYTVAMLTLDRRWLAAEGVDPGIVKAAVGLSGPYDFYPFTQRRSIDAMQAVRDPATTQPIRFARADAAPMLLVTSSEDTQVRPYNAVNLAARIRRLGGRVVLRNHRGLSHENVVMALSVPFRGEAPVLAESVTFLDRAMPAR